MAANHKVSKVTLRGALFWGADRVSIGVIREPFGASPFESPFLVGLLAPKP